METHSHRSLMAHHFIRALILGGFAFYIIRLVRLDTLTLYIAPRMTIYVKLAAMGLYLVAAVQLYQAFRAWQGQKDAAACDCEHPPSESFWRSAAVYTLFAVPLLVGFITPDTTIGSAMAGKKGMNLSAASAVKPTNGVVPAPAASPSKAPPVEPSAEPNGGESSAGKPADNLDALFPSDQFSEAYANYGKRIYRQPAIEVTEKSFMEILTTLDMFLDNFVGKKLTISGFVYRDETIAKDRFVLGRFAVQCCTADALPYGIMVSSGNLNANAYPNDTWLRITGTLEKTDYNGNQIMGLKLEKAEKIKPASDPYVYPDLDFGLEDTQGGGGG
ncbi:TIGR03943 family protein [Cohnella sp. CFH 77786]|uniref:TIGR03943 family putative permease subunit n=1 Tax=Cohnella sp. CFH 77786 TaxID=2662265 RepID=UPI001C6095A2|nr:TIGR03943 family protein [Cohnella sp. CFH 77786]MBW5447494.1 TIGR03943 family protein [Cohnella sp. CFH 77786]